MAHPHDQWWVSEYGCPPSARQTAHFQRTQKIFELGRELGRTGARVLPSLMRALLAGLRRGRVELEARRRLPHY